MGSRFREFHINIATSNLETWQDPLQRLIHDPQLDTIETEASYIALFIRLAYIK